MQKPLNYILDENNQPVPLSDSEADMATWTVFFTDGSRIVAQDTINEKFISTVFLGMDHNYFDNGDPILWETMVFPTEGNTLQEEFCRRYTSYADALAGHQETCQMVASGVPFSPNRHTLD